MKIGILASYLNTRRDIRHLLNLINQEHEVVLYAPNEEADKLSRMFPLASIVSVAPFTGFTRFLQILWQWIYLLFGQVPASRYNYFMTERIKLLNTNYKTSVKRIQSALLSLSRFTPKIISYDQYLNGLLWFKAPLETHPDIDVFLCFTEISNHWVFSRILSTHKPVWTYVYSWDHPCKMKTFSKRTRYLVWNEGLKKDLIDLQGINAEQIQVWGATQFTYLHAYFRAQTSDIHGRPYHFSYIYLGGATGYDTLAAQEVKYCVQIAGQLAMLQPDWKLVFRPYPFQSNREIYQPLRNLSNVIFDDSSAAADKLLIMQHALAFFHFGTTLGYEACYFDPPSFLIDFVDKTAHALLHGFVHQYQNDKYFNGGPDSLVIKSQAELTAVLTNLADDKAYLHANAKIRASTPLHEMPVLIEKLYDLIGLNDHVNRIV